MSVGTPTTATNATNLTVAVPAGLAQDDIVILLASEDNVNATFTWPAGFTQLDQRHLTLDGHTVGVAWKRQGAVPDSGTYTVAVGALTGNNGLAAIPLTGRHTVNPPVIGAVTADNTANAGTALTITATGLTATAGDDVLHVAMEDVAAASIGNGHSSWSLGTEIVDLIDAGTGWVNIGVAKAEAVAAGATGSETVSFAKSPTGNNGFVTYLIRVPVAPGGGGSPQSVTATGIATGEAFGSATVQPGPVTATPAGIASGEAFGAAAVAPGGVTVAPAGIASAEAFGSTVVQPGAVATAPAGIATGEAFGSPVVNAGGAIIALAGIATGEAFGAAALAAGPVSITLAGIATGEAFGAPTVTRAQLVAPAGIGSAEAFGSATVTAGTVSVAPAGVPSAESFGATTVTAPPITVAPAGIPSAESFGSSTIVGGTVAYVPDLPVLGRLWSPGAVGVLWGPGATLLLGNPGATGRLDPRPITGRLDG